MIIFSEVIWIMVTVVTLLAVFKFYLPYLIKKNSENGETENYETSKTFLLITYFSAIFIAVICGYFAGIRQLDWLSVYKMLLAFGVLVAISITDIKLYTIPNCFVLLLIFGRIVVFLFEVFRSDEDLLLKLCNSLIAGIVILAFLLLMSKITGGGIGYGDIKLFSALGYLCGVRAVLYTLIFSLLLCAIVSLFLLISKRKGLKDGLPMGPFIWLGFAMTIIFGLC